MKACMQKIPYRPGSVLWILSIVLISGDLYTGGIIAQAQTEWISATDQVRVQREGDWLETSFRFAAHGHLATEKDGATLMFSCEGGDVLLRLGQHAVPSYGRPGLGLLAVCIDGGAERLVYPLHEPREIVLARGLPPGPHNIRIEHRSTGCGAGARIEALGVSAAPTGELAFTLTGENHAYLVDARAVLTRDGAVIANRLVRNWLTGGCRLAGLPPGTGYRLEVQAIGWALCVVENISITAGRETELAPVHLAADPGTARGWLFPRLGRQTVRRPGENFHARFQAPDARLAGARLERRIGPAVISRPMVFAEDSSAAFYYDREVIAEIPDGTPPGLYDLIVQTRRRGRDGARELRSQRAVMVVSEYPVDPVFITWGHLDTQGQYQAEYALALAEIANLSGADMALEADACNPAYVAGALATLEIPYLVNFGNHQFPGFEQWYGPQEEAIDYGPDIRIVNRSLPWHESTAQTDALFAARPDARIKIINAFEHNAPVELLDRRRVALIHDAHGPGDRVMDMGATPTKRVGKSNSESFRMIRFRDGRVASCTYMGHATAPVPFRRGEVPPLRAEIDPQADGTQPRVAVSLINDLGDPFPNCRITLVMPAGAYRCTGGSIESAVASDCKRYAVLTIRADAPPESRTVVRVVKE
ncbi:MAG TPA: hypothetical protein PK843_07740 [bacterium]|nr:hypothetical protein [bacterium]